MKLTVYGSSQCPHCVEALKSWKERAIDVDFRDITGDMDNLRAFLNIRDSHDELFAEAKAEGRIGIPCVVLEDGTVRMGYQEF